MSQSQTAVPPAAATDPSAPAVASPTTDTSDASTSVATDTTAAAAASSATAAAVATPASPRNTAAAAAAPVVSALSNVLGDADADAGAIVEASKVLVDALENSSFIALLTAADAAAAS